MPKRTLAGACAATLVAAGASILAVTASPATADEAKSYVVLLDQGADVDAAVAALRADGASVTDVNRAIGLLTVQSKDSAFRTHGAAIDGVEAVAANRTIGTAPKREVSAIENENLDAAQQGRAPRKSSAKGSSVAKADPLDTYLWGMRMIGADRAHATTLGNRRVTVGVMDTGVQGDHPDIAPNFDATLSRNFTTDIPEIDGPCESEGCVDPAGEDDNGHGTHVAGTIAAAMNGFGLSGVAPKVKIVEVRSGQDSGYFFLGPTVDALTYSGDVGLDVVNMSFYVDPWLYNCAGGAPEDTPEQAADQDVVIEAMNRALTYAHDKGVTLVGSLGNSHEDLANPRVDTSSPDYGDPAHPRTIDNDTCWDLPVEGPNVIGTAAVGPSGKKADYSNYTTDLTSGEIEVASPGGWFRDGFGTPTSRTNENMILSTVPLVSLQDNGEVDADGNITALGQSTGVKKQCVADPAPGVAACGYYAFLQGTSMASPHTTGVAALAVSAHGHRMGNGFGMAPDAVRDLLMNTATDHACPEGGVQSYTQEGRSAEFTATCVGDPSFNGFYGAGIVNALGVVQ